MILRGKRLKDEVGGLLQNTAPFGLAGATNAVPPGVHVAYLGYFEHTLEQALAFGNQELFNEITSRCKF